MDSQEDFYQEECDFAKKLSLRDPIYRMTIVNLIAQCENKPQNYCKIYKGYPPDDPEETNEYERALEKINDDPELKSCLNKLRKNLFIERLTSLCPEVEEDHIPGIYSRSSKINLTS